MRALALMLLISWPSWACPEVVVPVDKADPVSRSPVWRGPLEAYHAGRYEAALKGFRQQGKKLESQAKRLFQPPPKHTTNNKAIQAFLERTLYGKPPALVAIGDGFSFPVAVLWAWGDAACRQGHLVEARTALTKVRLLRQGTELEAHELALALREGRNEDAAQLLRDLPPDSFLTPYAEARLALAQGRIADAREKLARAKLGSILPERSRLVDALLATLPTDP